MNFDPYSVPLPSSESCAGALFMESPGHPAEVVRAGRAKLWCRFVWQSADEELWALYLDDIPAVVRIVDLPRKDAHRLYLRTQKRAAKARLLVLAEKARAN